MKVDDVLAIAADEIGTLRSPIMLIGLSGFFDIAGAATAALDRLGTDDQTITVGEIDPDPFYDFTQARPVVVLDDGERRICWPDNHIDVARTAHRDLVLAIGTEPHMYWRTYADCLLTAASQLGCEVVVTVGAFADTVPHTRPARVTASSTDPRLQSRLGIGGPSYQGPTGVAGVIQVALEQAHIPGVSLRVGIPHYLMNTDHPAAVLALTQHPAGVLGLGSADVDDDERALITQTRDLHDEVVRSDDQLAFYVAQLEDQYDRDTEHTLPSADELGAQFEAFLDEFGSDGNDDAD